MSEQVTRPTIGVACCPVVSCLIRSLCTKNEYGSLICSIDTVIKSCVPFLTPIV